MKVRPILFSGPMVRALLEGRKTQTRRIVKLPLITIRRGEWKPSVVGGHGVKNSRGQVASERPVLWHTQTGDAIACPYGEVGDLLWVRETWADTNGESGPMISYRAVGEHFCTDDAYPVEYERYPNCRFTMWHSDLRNGTDEHSWRSSIHMPRWASRLTLSITEVRVQRLQDISEADAVAEGIERIGGPMSCCPWKNYRIGKPGEMSVHCSAPTRSYMTLWDSINGSGAWNANPWVWAMTFEVIRKNVDEVLKAEA